jgi:hypothetical protein
MQASHQVLDGTPLTSPVLMMTEDLRKDYLLLETRLISFFLYIEKDIYLILFLE